MKLLNLMILLSTSLLYSCSKGDLEAAAKNALEGEGAPVEEQAAQEQDSAPSAQNLTPSNGTEDTEKIITLSYTDADSDLATACSIDTLSNITETTSCSCSGGVCSAGVTGTSGYYGAASFNYTVTANTAVSNSIAVNFTIDSVTISCPTGFVAVDGNGVLGTNDFCVMKYEAKCDGVGACDQNDITSLPESIAAGTPWVSIRADESAPTGAGTGAQARCEAMSEGGFTGTFSLISNPEWMTIARDIENTASNWSGASVGSGMIPRGHSDNSPSSALAVTDVNDPYIGTGNNSGEAAGSGWEQKRTHTLSNGSEIWDLSGNVYEWTDWDAGSAGFTLGPIDEATGWKELSVAQTGSLLNDDFLPNGAYTSTNSFGQWYGGSGGAALRGGYWYNGALAGAFALGLVSDPSFSNSSVGFRCSYRP